MSQLQVTGEAKIRDIQGPVVANSGVITALDGAASQYVRGDGTLADFPTSTGGGSSVSYYLNGSVNQGTFGGSTYYEMSKTPIIGAGTDFAVSTNGLVAQFITDANDPDLLEVPGGNFNVEFYFSVNNNTGNPTVYAELYKYDGATFTLLGSSVAVPESLNQGTTIAPYYFAIPVGTAALALTDRIAIRIYANVDGRTVTLHTENSHLCQVVTTFSKGMVSLNNLTDQSQFITTGTSGTNFNIVSTGDTHTFNLPVASATNTGKLSNTDWSTFNAKQAALSFTAPLVNTSNTISIPAATSLVDGYLDNLDWVNFNTAYNNMIVSAAVTGTTTKTLTLTQQDAGTITASWTDINTDAVTSVFGRTGAVVAASGDYTTTQVTEGTNLYFTNLRAQNAITLTTTGTSGAATYSGGTLNIPQYQGVLTNPVTGTGTTNTLPKFTGTSAIGNSNITDTGSLITLGSNTTISSGGLGIGTTSLTGYSLRVGKSATGATIYSSITSSEQIQTDVTSVYRSFYSLPNTNAATFTLGTLAHFQATQDTFGAGSTVTNQYGYLVSSNLIGATNNYGFRGAIPSGANRWNLFMDGTADNYLAGNIGIGASDVYVSSGPILTTTLTNGGSGYVDGTYTDVAATAIAANGFSALFTIVVSGGIVTTATLTWGGSSYKVGQTLTVSNTLLGGTGSGLVITVATVDSSQLKITNANGGDITLFRLDNSVNTGDNIGTIKWEGLDSNAKGSGLYAEIAAFGAGTAGGAYLSFFTRSATAGSSLVEAMRIADNGALGIGTTSLTGYSLRVGKNITGATTSRGIASDGIVQSDVVTAYLFATNSQTAAATFSTDIVHYFGSHAGTGAGSTITSNTAFMTGNLTGTSVFGFRALSSLTGSSTTQGFRGDIAAATNNWNLYMNGTANNYMAGSLGIGATSLAGMSLRLSKNITGATTGYGVHQDGVVQSDVTAIAHGFTNRLQTQATAFTLPQYNHYYAVQVALGAGSAVTTQAGFFADSSLTGATNNFGFYGNIASGTNRWNLYMAGTAANYMAGSLNIGTTTLSGFTLDVNGTARVQDALTITKNQNLSVPLITLNNTNSGNAGRAAIVQNSDTAISGFGVVSSTWNADTNINSNESYWYGSNGILLYSGSTTAPIRILTNSVERVRVKSTGQMRFVPLAADPSGAQAGDVYYNSTISALKLYDGTQWRTITVI